MTAGERTTDVVVVGGGPGGHAAALTARRRGANVVLVEREQLGGQCVHHTCIPNALVLGAAASFFDAQELSLAGVFDAGEELRLRRAVNRKDALVAKLAAGAATSLRAAGVEVVNGGAALLAPDRVAVDGTIVNAGAVVLATGARWEAPKLDGVPDRLVVTLDAVSRLDAPPAHALVLGGGPAATAFSVEAAVLLAAAGTAVTYAAPTDQVVPALDADVDAVVQASLESIGIKVLTAARTTTSDRADGIAVVHARGTASVAADLVVAPDGRVPNVEGLGLDALGLRPSAPVAVDDACRTAVPGLLAVGDVTGGPMLSAAASHMGRVAGATVTDGPARTRLGVVPHVLHTAPTAGWVGLNERDAAGQGYLVDAALVDLSTTARAVTLGGREGVAKLVAERELGHLLGVQIVGPEAPELVALAAQALQAELTIDDLAEAVHWHPSTAECLGDAARMWRERSPVGVR
jgi:dihydrolipoamide dehydrogenase